MMPIIIILVRSLKKLPLKKGLRKSGCSSDSLTGSAKEPLNRVWAKRGVRPDESSISDPSGRQGEDQLENLKRSGNASNAAGAARRELTMSKFSLDDLGRWFVDGYEDFG